MLVTERRSGDEYTNEVERREVHHEADRREAGDADDMRGDGDAEGPGCAVADR